VGYREFSPPRDLASLVECAWAIDAPTPPGPVLPDGCMDLIRMDGTIVVAGPDTAAATVGQREPVAGLRFRPGALPRLLGVPASELRNTRVALDQVVTVASPRSLINLTRQLGHASSGSQTAPWSVDMLHRLTARLSAGDAVDEVAEDAGWTSRTLRRHCHAVYGYGPATLRRVLRFRRAVQLLRTGTPVAQTAALTGYADQPHLSREVREFAGVAPGELAQSSGANRSTVVPSGSVTDA
jgi:AraC-like DNA-binding protein